MMGYHFLPDENGPHRALFAGLDLTHLSGILCTYDHIQIANSTSLFRIPSVHHEMSILLPLEWLHKAGNVTRTVDAFLERFLHVLTNASATLAVQF